MKPIFLSCFLSLFSYFAVAQSSVKWGNNAAEDDFQHWDTGLQFEAGLTVRWFRLSATYALGLANLQPHPDANQVVKKNRMLSVGLSAFLSR